MIGGPPLEWHKIRTHPLPKFREGHKGDPWFGDHIYKMMLDNGNTDNSNNN